MRKNAIWKGLALVLMAGLCFGLTGCDDGHADHDHDKNPHHDGDGHDKDKGDHHEDDGDDHDEHQKK